MFVIWIEGTAPGRAQDMATNSSTITIIDGSSTNAAPDTTTTSVLPPSGEESLANGPYLPTPPLVPSENDSSSSTINSNATPPEFAPPILEKASPSLEETATLYAHGKSDEALATINAVLSKEPKNINAYIMRGAVYSQKQAWAQAEKDYETALEMDPKNDGVKFDLADLKFKQKLFAAAREAFVPLQNNPDFEVRDLIKYKIYLCDLLDGHDEAASKELDVFNQAGSNASYYFGNAAWNLVHKKPNEAKSWLVSASHIYPERKQLIYTSILNNMGYLPLPPSVDDTFAQ